MFWKLDIRIFLGTLRSVQLEFNKAFNYAIEFITEKLEKDKIADISPATLKGAPSTFLPIKCLKRPLPDEILMGMNFGVTEHLF